MTSSDLRKFFKPEAIAVVGASADRSRFGGKVIDRLQRFGATGPVFPVTRSASEIRGLKCYPSIRDLPQRPDHVGIMVPAAGVFDVLEDCKAVGVPFATVFSSGFAETGTSEGRDLQARLKSFAEASGIRIMGPNCNGVVNFVDGFALTSTGTVAGGRGRAGRIGLAAQTGGAAQVNVMWRAQQAGLSLSYEVSCGNSADLDVLDFVDFMIEDPNTDVIMVIAESFRDGKKLVRSAQQAARRNKPIVVLKLGRTEAGSRAAASHTGALTGSDAVHDAAFHQLGIIRVDDCNELYECAMMLQSGRLPKGRGMAALSASGGNAVLLADIGAQFGATWPAYQPSTQAALAAILPKHGQANNPTDVTSAVIGKADSYRQVVETIAGDPQVDVVVPILTMAAKSDVEQVADAIQRLPKPGAILWTGGCTDAPDLTPATLVTRGIPVYRDAKGCLRAVTAAMRYSEFLTTRAARLQKPAERSGPHRTDEAWSILSKNGRILTEAAAKRMLAAYGLSVTRERVARTADEAKTIARDLGSAVALKVQSPDIPHKTEAGAVRLNVRGDSDVETAFDTVLAAARRHAPAAQIDGVLVQEMLPAGGVEMIVGIAADVTFGAVTMVGLGGIYAEVFKDVSYRLGPISVDGAREMVEELRAYSLLRGVRGQPPKDIAALCKTISDISFMADDLSGSIRELDINPVIVLPEGKGAWIADALIVQDDRAPGSAAQLEAADVRP